MPWTFANWTRCAILIIYGNVQTDIWSRHMILKQKTGYCPVLCANQTFCVSCRKFTKLQNRQARLSAVQLEGQPLFCLLLDCLFGLNYLRSGRQLVEVKWTAWPQSSVFKFYCKVTPSIVQVICLMQPSCEAPPITVIRTWNWQQKNSKKKIS